MEKLKQLVPNDFNLKLFSSFLFVWWFLQWAAEFTFAIKVTCLILAYVKIKSQTSY